MSESIIFEFINKHFDFLGEKKITELLSKTEFIDKIDFNRFDFINTYKDPLMNKFIYCFITQDTCEKYDNPELATYLDVIYSDKQNVGMFADIINDTNEFKKSFRYYELYGKVVEHQIGLDTRTYMNGRLAWKRLISRLYGKYMHSKLMQYIKNYQET